MSYRDDELKRLEQYCKGLGISISYKKKRRQDPEAEWDMDSNYITIYLSSKLTKLQIILNIIHELGHHFDFVYNNRKLNDKVTKAWNKENSDIPMTKAQRKLIYNDEYNASLYRKQVVNELNLKISKERLAFDIEMDLFVYRYFYLRGHYPNNQIYLAKKKKLWYKYNLGRKVK